MEINLIKKLISSNENNFWLAINLTKSQCIVRISIDIFGTTYNLYYKHKYICTIRSNGLDKFSLYLNNKFKYNINNNSEIILFLNNATLKYYPEIN